MRDALVEEDYNEAYHQLYSIADPEFTSFTPWDELEEGASSGSRTGSAGAGSVGEGGLKNSGWVFVQDGLPPRGEYVFCYNIHTDLYYKAECGDSRWWTGSESIAVTHWIKRPAG